METLDIVSRVVHVATAIVVLGEASSCALC